MGNPARWDAVFDQVYPQLKQLAASQMMVRPGQTLTPTAVVNETYLKLSQADQLDLVDRRHFMICAAKAMRHIVIDHARAQSAKRRGGDKRRVTLTDVVDETQPALDLLDLDTALDDLEAIDPALKETGGVEVLCRSDHERHCRPPGDFTSHRESKLGAGPGLSEYSADDPSHVVNPEQQALWKQADDIFASLLQQQFKPDHEAVEQLGLSQDLQACVLALLDGFYADGPVDGCADDLIKAFQSNSQSGRNIGGWILDEPIGSGGMATVHRCLSGDGRFQTGCCCKAIKWRSTNHRRHRSF